MRIRPAADASGESIAAAAVEAAPAMVEVVDEIVLLAPGESREPEPEISLPDNDEALIRGQSASRQLGGIP